jgi:alkanesulfonate monooxygenase SsuD/methylene tetrahydromethanopterin reductase-like flavin-dependent oxidoreductase (luciferase family)
MRNDISRQWAYLSPFVSGPELTAAACTVEAAGMAGIMCAQTFGSPFVPLSHCGAVTERVPLLSGVLNAFARSPFETACSAIDLDRLSGGRLILGLGTSYPPWNEGFYGLPDEDRPVERLRETIEVIRRVVAGCHTGELGRFAGRHLHHDWTAFPGTAPALRPEIPIWVAAYQPRMLRLAAEIGDGWMTAVWSVDWTVQRGAAALAEALARAGRERSDLHWHAIYFVAVNEDRSEAVHEARATVEMYAKMPHLEPFFAAAGFGAEARACQAGVPPTDDMVETFVILGTADECRKRFEPVWELADSFLLAPPIWGLAPERMGSYAAAIADTFYA